MGMRPPTAPSGGGRESTTTSRPGPEATSPPRSASSGGCGAGSYGRRGDVVEGVDDRLGRIDLLHLHVGDEHTGAVTVENLLQQRLGALLDEDALERQRILERRLADDFANAW